jgi:plasmid maintenance system antidote protein VapI|tara:strand:+ start:121 stop:747 length:627 start_codon:yes stop_codon:yes gene_type:complete
MRIAAVVKIKHGAIWQALQKLGWNQSELARQLNMHPTRVGEIINLKRRPTDNEVNRIELAFLDAGVSVDVISEWPEMFKMRQNNLTYYKDVETDRLLSHTKQLTIEEKESLQILMDQLTPIEADILMSNMVYGVSLNKLAEKWEKSRSTLCIVKEELEEKLERFRFFMDKDGASCPEQFGMYIGKHYPTNLHAKVMSAREELKEKVAC